MAGLELPGGSHGQVIDIEARRRQRLTRWTTVGVGVAAALALGFYLRQVFNPLLIALLLAYMLNPLVEKAEGWGWSRQRAVLAIFLGILICASLALGLGAIKLVGQAQRLGRALAGERVLDPADPRDRALIEQAQSGKAPPSAIPLGRADGQWFLDRNGDGKLDPGLLEQVVTTVYSELGGSVSRQDLEALVTAARAHAASLTRAGSEVTDWLRDVVEKAGAFVQYMLLVPLYTFFLLQSFSRLRDGVRDHLPGAYRARIVQIARRIDRQVAAFFRGKLIVAMLKGLLTWLGFWLVGVPFSFPIGLAAGALSVVPFLGPVCGGALAIVASYAPQGWPTTVLLILVVLAVVEVVEAVAQPVILGREVGLDPLALILSFFVFGELFGLFGVLLAVPIACAAKILFVELALPEIRALAREPGPAVGPPTGRLAALPQAVTAETAGGAEPPAPEGDGATPSADGGLPPP